MAFTAPAEQLRGANGGQKKPALAKAATGFFPSQGDLLEPVFPVITEEIVNGVSRDTNHQIFQRNQPRLHTKGL